MASPPYPLHLITILIHFFKSLPTHLPAYFSNDLAVDLCLWNIIPFPLYCNSVIQQTIQRYFIFLHQPENLIVLH